MTQSTTNTANPDYTIELAYTRTDPFGSEVKVEREIDLSEVFSEGRLILWSDWSGWNGIKYDADEDRFYDVNVPTHGEGYQVEITLDEVGEHIQRHIEDPDAGGVGDFELNATPP